MANLTMMIGATADIASGAELDAGLAPVNGKLDRLLTGRRLPTYLDNPIGAQAATGVATVLIIDGPPSGKVWDIRQLAINGGEDSGALSAIGASVSTGAAAGSNVALSAGAAVTGFTWSSGTVAVAVSDELTLTGLPLTFTPTGTARYKVTYGPSGGVLNVTFPNPIPAINAATAITLTAPATAGGAAYSLDIYGAVQAAWYKTQASFIPSPAAVAPQLLVSRRNVPTEVNPASAKSVFLHYGENLVAVVYGASAGQNLIAIARVAEWNDGDTERRLL